MYKEHMSVKHLVACGIPLRSFQVLQPAAELRLVERRSKNQDRDAIRALLQQHADVNASQGDGATALHWAAHWDDLSIADMLISARANVKRGQ